MARRLSKTKTIAAVLTLLAMCAGSSIARASGAQGSAPVTCEKLVLNGEVSAGHEWKAAIGEGWAIRVVPIPKDKTSAGIGGWDLVVDREEPAGFPDAVLIATPPYNLINPREIGDSYGLRAQDAIGWNPRHFRFMTNRSAFRQAQRLYLLLNRYGELGGKTKEVVSGRKAKTLARAKTRFMKLAKESSPGQFDIVGARLTPGIATVKPYATNWALQSAKTPHTEEPPPGGAPTALGNLDWIRFSLTLWVPESWRAPSELQHPRMPCPE